MMARDYGWCAVLTLGLMTVPHIATGQNSGRESTVTQASATEESKDSDTFLLRYRFRGGTKVNYEVQHETTISMFKGQAKQTAKNGLTTRKHLRIVDVDRDGNAVIEPVIDSVKLSAQFDGGQKQVYDSANDKTPPKRFAGVKKTIGKPLVRLKVSPRGQLLKATPLLPGKVQKLVVKNNGPPKAPNDASKNFLIVFPERAVKIGSSWIDKDLKVSLLVTKRLRREFTILRKYKLVSVKNGVATISLQMESAKPINDPNLKVQLVQRLTSGTLQFDIVRGEMTSRELVVDNKVYNFIGDGSLLHVKGSRHERLIRAKRIAGKP